jgi:hypothetical protein
MSLPSGTFVNKARQLYASADQAADKWYTFPSQTGDVLLVDASGTQVLQSVDGNLFYNQELLARASDIEDISQWSDYPVLNPAGVDFNGNPLKNATNIDATGSITAGGAIEGDSITVSGDIVGGGTLTLPDAITAGSLTVSNGINTLTSSISTSGLSTNSTIPTLNQIVTGSVITETIEATTSATLKGASLSDALDMANNPINRASSINISNSGFAPYGQLTSPNGTQLLWNGAAVATGAAGDTSLWANFAAVAPIKGGGQPMSNVTTINTTSDITSATNITAGTNLQSDNLIQIANPTVNNPLKVTAKNASGLLVSSLAGGIANVASAGNIESTASGDVNLTTTGGNVNVTAYNNVVVDSGNDINMTADGGLNPILLSAININAKNGGGGQVNIVADPAALTPVPGAVYITANGGTINIPNPPPEPPTPVTVGGLISLDANGGFGLYTASSAIKMSAAGINSYAGAIPSIGSVAGYNFIYGTAGVNICAGLPSAGFQLPLTSYIYGVGVPGAYGGVRLQSPNGIQMLSDTYMTNLYPLDTDGLNIAGRSFLGTGNVNIEDVQTFEMNGGAALKTDNISSVSNSGILYTDNLIAGTPSKGIYANFLKPSSPTSTGNPNLVISSSSFAGINNYVEINNADVIAFDTTGAGSLTGVKSINGASWPPPTGDASLWAAYPATQTVNLVSQGITACGPITGLTTINGATYAGPDQWATFPAVQAVDLSANSLDNVGNMNLLANASIISAGALNIFSDASGDLSIASNGGGNVSIGTGNAGDINIATGGTGNEVTIAGDVVNLSATQGVRVSAPVLDMDTNNIYNVNTLRGSLNTDLRVVADGTGNLNQEGAIVNITAPTKVSFTTPSIDVEGADIINVANVTNEAANVLTVQSTANLIVSAETNLSLVSDAADVSIQGLTGVSVYAATGNVNLTADSGEVVVQDSVLNMNNHKITNLTAGTAGTDAVNYTQLTFRDSTEFYVSAQGSDANNGSILAPFRTIQAAITAAELISSAALVCHISVFSGHYNESLTFNKGYIVLTGTLQSQTGNEVCEITGSISIAVAGASDIFNRQITFQGFNITCGAGQAITDTSTTPHTVSFQDCKAFVVNQFFVSTASASDMRVYMTNVEVDQNLASSTLPVISTNVGLLEFERLDMSIDGNCTAIEVGGTSVLSRFSLSSLDTTNTATTLLPLLSITSTTTSAHSFGNVAFAYASTVAKTATSAVYIASGINTTIIMLNNVFTLSGTASSTNYTVGYNGVGSPAILGVNNTSLSVPVLLPQTTRVQSGITQVQYTNIDPPVLGSYSSSIDQAMVAANTPQALTFNTSQNFHGTLLVAGSRIYVGSNGNFQINYAATLINSSAAAISGNIFLRKNGTTVANTGSVVTVPATNVNTAVSPQAIVSMNSGDYIEVWMTGPLTLSANATGAVGVAAATPSVILNITQIR